MRLWEADRSVVRLCCREPAWGSTLGYTRRIDIGESLSGIATFLFIGSSARGAGVDGPCAKCGHPQGWHVVAMRDANGTLSHHGALSVVSGSTE